MIVKKCVIGDENDIDVVNHDENDVMRSHDKLKFRKFMIMRMIMLMLNNRDTLISIIREQLTNIFRLVNRTLF